MSTFCQTKVSPDSVKSQPILRQFSANSSCDDLQRSHSLIIPISQGAIRKLTGFERFIPRDGLGLFQGLAHRQDVQVVENMLYFQY